MFTVSGEGKTVGQARFGEQKAPALFGGGGGGGGGDYFRFPTFFRLAGAGAGAGAASACNSGGRDSTTFAFTPINSASFAMLFRSHSDVLARYNLTFAAQTASDQ